MDAIEPHWVASLYFAAFATSCALAFLILSGMFPLRARPDAAKSGLAALLVAGNAALLILLLTGTGFYGYSELKWSTLIVVAGLVVLFAPGLFEALPAPLRDGRAGLIVLAGAQALALAVLAKVGGHAWANMS
ncbi:hypothetical protein IVB30_35555 [Bradyrhizobium sp. 200]|uniref:hypothetical protein n=1 Tax=Bradyrhizobium sp. 200 TaxID=2782665 RepID=UPI001FFEDB9C|nr:hypothetical protein [Bradyrhizobium sp. 200]UPJ48336.1 hypothetical protein IVB30_35555 [Bradyrhizobium sp. 200]